MCGFLGIFKQQACGRNSVSVVKNGLRMLSHRGPDSEGIWQSPSWNYTVGHCRLAVLDLTEAGHQPMVSADGRYVLSFNGEIYNFQELKTNQELLDLGPWRSSTDGEVLLRALIVWGVQALSHIDGMFALAFYDSLDHVLFLARDRFGEKPLFVCVQNDSTLYFSSSLTSLIALLPAGPEPNPEAISLFLEQYAISSPLTAYKGIECIRPGHWVRLSKSQREDGCYWEPHYSNDSSMGFKNICDSVERILHQSLKRRLVSDVPLGCFLSGGVDSSLTTAMTARELGPGLCTFSVGFVGENSLDFEWAKKVAKIYETSHEGVWLDESSLEELPKMIWHFGQPFGDFSCVPSYHVARFAKRKVTVVLTGDGGDEIFGGYMTVFAMHLAEMTRKMMPETWAIAMSLIFSKMFEMSRLIHFSKIAKMFEMSSTTSERAYQILCKRYPEIVESSRIPSEFSWQSLYYDRAQSIPVIQRVLYSELKGCLPDKYLTKMDVAAMAHSVETRTPFLSIELFNLMKSVPPNLYLKGFVRKAILKKVAEKYLPHDLLYRKKMGFTPPLGRWLRHPRLASVLKQMCSSDELAQWISVDQIRITVMEHLEEKQNHETVLFVMMALIIWHKMFITKTLTPDMPLSECSLS